MPTDATTAARYGGRAIGGGMRGAAIVVCATMLMAIAACDRAEPRPESELLVVTGDSTFWVTISAGQVRVRGVPMLIAQVDGRFQELYVADEDRSYYDAVFVGHRLFARDLVRGDSVELHRDTVVARLAEAYARAHPDEQPLSPDEPENDNASIQATSDVEILGVHGPYISYEHHRDVDARDEPGADHEHAYRRGVVDARTGASVELAALFGSAAADSLIRSARREWDLSREAIIAGAGAGSRASRAIADFQFDASSFAIGSVAQAPTIRFGVPASGVNPDVEPVELSPQAVTAPAWWAPVAAELPIDTGETMRWARTGDTLTVRPVSRPRAWLVTLRIGGASAQEAMRVGTPAERVIWLDSSLTTAERGALSRAFDEAAAYDGSRQVALARGRAPLHLAGHVHPGAGPRGARVAARVNRPDDADGRERPRPRLWRSDPRDARQDGGRQRRAALAQAVRHGIG